MDFVDGFTIVVDFADDLSSGKYNTLAGHGEYWSVEAQTIYFTANSISSDILISNSYSIN